jgi:KipI family sensor histidine kinase inhibitor
VNLREELANRYGMPRMLTAGEQGLVVEFGNVIDQVVNTRVQSLARLLAAKKVIGLREMVPTYRSLMIFFDPLRIARDDLIALVVTLDTFSGDNRSLAETGRIIRVPVCYEGEFGPDLNFVAGFNGISPEDVIKIHCSAEYPVYMLGFLPGFPYLGDLPSGIAAPRLEKPRRSVAKGSVGIAGKQSGIYSLESPGGWRIIGRTPLRLFDPESSRPFLMAAGDTVKFEPINENEYHSLKKEIESGTGSIKAMFYNADGPVGMIVVKPGFMTTVQDEGRFGFQEYGMPVAGAMDRYAYRVANILAGNELSSAVLEMTLTGGAFRFGSDAYVSVCGADMRGMLNGAAIRNWSAFPVTAGSELSFGPAVSGCRSYLAVRGGLDVPLVMGSRSTLPRAGIGGFHGRVLKAGDILRCGKVERTITKTRVLPRLFMPRYSGSIVLRVLPGPQEDHFTEEGISVFYSSEYRVSSRNDRMGYLLEGPAVRHGDGADIVSDALCPGAVQVPGNGLPIIMTADHQTTGGYAKIGAVIGPDLTGLAQMRQGNVIRFVRCTDEEAVEALEREMEIYVRIRTEFAG